MQGYEQYVNLFQQHPGENDAQRYGVQVAQADVGTGAAYWKAIGVHHLTPLENQGKHNVYVEVRDRDGNSVRNPAQLRVTFQKSTTLPVETTKLDKGSGEPGTNFALFKEDRAEVWLTGSDLPSDRVVNLHTRHAGHELMPNGQAGSYEFHHSFLIIYQESDRQTSEPQPSTGDEQERKVAWEQFRANADPASDLAVYARQNDLGAPISAEVQAAGFRMQGFANGIVTVRESTPDDIRHIDW